VGSHELVKKWESRGGLGEAERGEGCWGKGGFIFGLKWWLHKKGHKSGLWSKGGGEVRTAGKPEGKLSELPDGTWGIGMTQRVGGNMLCEKRADCWET